MTSLRIDTSEWISSSLIIGNTGLGVLGQNIPSTGTAGPSFLYNDLSLPADNDKEIRALVLTYPSAGTLTVYEDGSFDFIGAPDGTYTFTYQLYVDGVATGSVATVTLNVGSLGTSLAASAVGVSSATSSMSTSIKLMAAAVASAVGTAALSTQTSGLSSSGVSSTTATAALSTSIQLNASATASVITSATVVTTIQLASGAISISTTSSDLLAVIRMSAQAVVGATATADLSVLASGNYIYANGVSTSVAAGSLTTSVMLRCIATAIAKGTASLTVSGTVTEPPVVMTVKFKNPNYKVTFK